MRYILGAINGTSCFLILCIVSSSCKSGLDFGGNPTAEHPGSHSTTTNMPYNRPISFMENRGFRVFPFQGQPDGPNLVFIEGGRSVLGSFEEDVTYAHDNIERAVTVASFYMDETEVSNIHWLEYEYYIKQDSDEYFWKNNLPDSTVWAKNLSFNDPYVANYYRYPGFRYLPPGRQCRQWRLYQRRNVDSRDRTEPA